jgi:hypothetical protein
MCLLVTTLHNRYLNRAIPENLRLRVVNHFGERLRPVQALSQNANISETRPLTNLSSLMSVSSTPPADLARRLFHVPFKRAVPAVNLQESERWAGNTRAIHHY